MTGRRTFLGSAASGLLILKPETVFGSQANSAIELGIIGAGGRGIWIGGLFKEHTLTHLAAYADPFQDRLDLASQKLGVESSRLYKGINGYQELLASKVDAVAIESPAYFHPEQVSAALAAGKHIYLAKPLAVDVAGCKSILASGDKAKGKISFLADFQSRVRPMFQEAARRVHAGDIGTPVIGQVFYHTGRLQRKDKPGASEAENRLRNWSFDKTLSGDIIVEQNIHVIDMGNWFLQGHPVSAIGTGGRKGRIDVGDAWDHFIVTFDYPNGVKVAFSSGQFTKGYNILCARIYGTGGTLDSHYGGYIRITGDKPWPGTEKDDTFVGGAVTNVKSFTDSIRTGQYVNNIPESIESNLTAILGRMAAYQQKTVTWDEMMRSNEKLEANLKL
ncbi:MAG TPA: Gfo/Idh/MocA family oxidoreductase [Bryobacteraceae bacterium]|nr:Gfo/Idh/MocA family oxidoreductase [Bryobacteraceae bacterium]